MPLPLVEPVYVEGDTCPERKRPSRMPIRSRDEYLAKGQERIIVTLMRPRMTAFWSCARFPGGRRRKCDLGRGYSRGLLGAGPGVGVGRRAPGWSLISPPMKNDVLIALTGPGDARIDAKNEIRIDPATVWNPPRRAPRNCDKMIALETERAARGSKARNR